MARFATLNRYQLAGHLSNLDFWIDEVRHRVGVIDTYVARFRRLKEAHDAYFDSDSLRCTQTPALRRVPHTELHAARRELLDALYAFLLRLYRERLIGEARVRAICRDVGTGVNPDDFKLLS